MPQLIPIRGLRYTARAGELSGLLAPPYDVISPEQQSALGRNAFNAIHLELATGGEDRYEQVSRTVRSWEQQGVLRRDPEPMVYVYEQEFEEAGTSYRRRALIAGVEAQPWEEGAVKPHEFTMSGPKEDRLRLLETAGVQFSPVLMVARDRAGQLSDFLKTTVGSRAPDQEGAATDGLHRLWAVPATRFEMRQLAPLLSESFYIADGHHRYETAVTYKLRRLQTGESLARDHPARFALSAIVPAADPGLIIRPIHRLVPRPTPGDWRARLEELFDVTEVATGSDPANTARSILERGEGAIVAAGLEQGTLHVLRLRDTALLDARQPPGHSEAWGRILPNVVRYGILETLWGIGDEDLRSGAVEYTHDEREALALPPRGVALLIEPIRIDEVISLADRGDRMPQKSTFFYPKLGTGLVFHPLQP